MMEWIEAHADLLLAVAMAFFVATLLPTIYSQLKAKCSTVPLLTSIPMTFFLALVGVVNLALSLPLAASMIGLQVIGWLVLAWQRYLYGEKASVSQKPLFCTSGGSTNDEAVGQRRRRLTRYGLSEGTCRGMLLRQHGRCAGCQKEISLETARIDYDRTTDRLRGLLCDQCNWALGFVRNDRRRLYQLAAYLELDRSRPVVYLIGSLRNPKVVEVGNDIRNLGIECVDNWVAAGEIADDAWRDYSIARGRTYKEALESREANHVYYFDRAYLNLCDAVVLLYPVGRSGHIEFGYGIGQGKRGYILMEDQPERYDVMLQFADNPLFYDRQSLLNRLKADLKG